ncbi:hypothetical protein RISW2_04075 [Roseivivax isoporae LMG 25204]|uniref:Flagellar protein FlgJ N-terminal domain-containing protein n=1 Tax=Roseivivax isoporae LMG 25204 TaxID=1449351 RepID=X7F9V8_9RHOB|nr:hypothetical protein RISW2_04075 [Roseivivax isoporae LMG 25204]
MSIPPLAPMASRPENAADPAQAARDFEAAFLSQAVDQMLQTAGEDIMGGGQAGEAWRSFLSNAVADAIADQSRTGIAQSVAAAIGAYRRGAGA